MRRNLALLAISILATLVALEIAARYVLRDIGTTGDNTSYFSERWRAANQPRRNVWGYRERDFAAWPEPGTYRIAVIGDSLTYGQGIAEEERVSNRLEASLKLGGDRFEVLNFGIPGAEYEQNTDSLALALEHAHPDFVLIQWFTNDVSDPDMKMPRPIPLAWKAHKLIQPYSALYFLMNTKWGEIQRSLDLVPVEDYYERDYGTPDRPLAKRARARLERMLSLAREQGVPVAMVLWPPTLDEDGPYSAYDFIYDQVLDTCSSENVFCLDLRPIFSTNRAGNQLVVNRYDGHPSGRANELAAEAILRAFGPTWVDGAERKRTGAS